MVQLQHKECLFFFNFRGALVHCIWHFALKFGLLLAAANSSFLCRGKYTIAANARTQIIPHFNRMTRPRTKTATRNKARGPRRKIRWWNMQFVGFCCSVYSTSGCSNAAFCGFTAMVTKGNRWNHRRAKLASSMELTSRQKYNALLMHIMARPR